MVFFCNFRLVLYGVFILLCLGFCGYYLVMLIGNVIFLMDFDERLIGFFRRIRIF